MSHNIETRDVLLGSNLYFGKLYTKDKNNDIEIFETLVLANGKDEVKGILIDNKMYSMNGNVTEEHFESLCNFEDLLVSRHLNCFVKPIYTTTELEAAIAAYNRTFEMSAEELLSITKVSKVAADWWADFISNPKLEGYDNTIQGMMANAIATTIKEFAPVPTDEQLECFKTTLQNQIRMDLLSYGQCRIGDDYNSEKKLIDASKKSKINSYFPWKTTMIVYTDEVEVNTPNGKEVIYQSVCDYQKIKTDNK